MKRYVLTSLAALGATYCLAYPVLPKALCASSGCSIYAGYQFAGLSFYAWGALAFALVALLGLPVWSRHLSDRWLRIVLPGLVAADALFLLYQTLFWPCTSCLVVAVLIGACALAAWQTHPSARTVALKGACLAWGLFFATTTISAGKEIFLKPWTLAGAAQSTAHVFFSPTCPSCQDQVQSLLEAPEASDYAFIPVAKNERDLELIAAVSRSGISGLDAVRALFQSNPDTEKAIPLDVRLTVLRNKMYMASRGINRVPVIVTSSLPRPSLPLPFLGMALPGAVQHVPQDEGEACSITTETPCEEKTDDQGRIE